MSWDEFHLSSQASGSVHFGSNFGHREKSMLLPVAMLVGLLNPESCRSLLSVSIGAVVLVVEVMFVVAVCTAFVASIVLLLRLVAWNRFSSNCTKGESVVNVRRRRKEE